MSDSPIGTPLTPEQIAKLKQDVLMAENGMSTHTPSAHRVSDLDVAALEAARRVKVDRIKHAAQLQELSEQVAFRPFLHRPSKLMP